MESWNVEEKNSGLLIFPSKLKRLICTIVAIVLPIVCFALAFDGTLLMPEWQSDRLSDYLLIMLTGKVAIVFYPFLVYSMICLLLLLISSQRFSCYFVVRFGIYTGVVLSLQYTVILGLSMFGLRHILDVRILNSVGLNMLALGIPIGISKLYKWAKEKLGVKRTWLIILGLAICLWLILSWLSGSIAGPAILLIMFVLSAAPIWCLVTALTLAVPLFRCYEFEKLNLVGRGLWAVVWGTAFLGVWRTAILRTIEIYASLPTSPPDCYIATAAARGHPNVVKSQSVVIGNRLVLVNPQMRYLKCMELMLMVSLPWAHRLLRKAYDVVGCSLARLLVPATAADVAYILLKPIEWWTRGVLKALIPDIDAVAQQVYAGAYSKPGVEFKKPA